MIGAKKRYCIDLEKQKYELLNLASPNLAYNYRGLSQTCLLDEGDPSTANGRSKSHNTAQTIQIKFSLRGKVISLLLSNPTSLSFRQRKPEQSEWAKQIT